MKRLIFIALGLGGLMSSCVNSRRLNTVHIYKNQKVYKHEKTATAAGNVQTVKEYTLTTGQKAIVKDDEKGFVTIDFMNPADPGISAPRAINKPAIAVGDQEDKGFHYPSKFEYSNVDMNRNFYFRDKSSFKYLSINPIFQASTIPFKYRAPRDTFNYELTTSGNLGFVWGMKFTHHNVQNFYYSQNAAQRGKVVAHKNSQFSITPGIFFGPTTIGLKSSNTRNNVLQEKTVLGFNTGALIVFGFNKFHIGYAFGTDLALGSEGSKWIYDKTLWSGFVLSLDFVK